MRNRWIKRVFPIIALLLLTPWPVAYAYDSTDGMPSQDAIQIEVAEASVAPSMTVFGKAIGGVTPGDLFYIDATDNPADIVATLYLTNTQELIHHYRYLILKVGVYAESASGEWDEASTAYGMPFPDTFVTMRNARVSFTLPGLAKYRIAIDGGSFYCSNTNAEAGSASPQFYLTVD